MAKSVNIQIASVHLTSKFWQTFVAIMGVTFGVSMYIFMNSFMNGVNKTQDDLAFSALSHIRIYNQDNNHSYNPIESEYDNSRTVFNIHNRKSIQYTSGIKNSSGIVSLVEKQEEVVAVARQINFSVFFRSGSKKINGRVSGIELEPEDKLFKSSETVTQGNWNNLQTHKSGIIIGKLLAKDLGLQVNSSINVLTSDGVSKNYIIVGIFESSIKEIDKTKAYLNITAARQLLGENSDYASDILINIKDRDYTAPVVKKLGLLIPLQIESWQEANEQLVAGASLRNVIAIAVSFTILLVAGFGIYNIMNMTINEKIKEIAILKATGFSGKDIKSIFLSQAGAIGLLGGFLGVVLGYLISLLINQVPFNVASLETLPIYFRVQDFVLAVVFGLLTTLIAGYLPSKKAARVDPVTIIRG
ncbi:MAG TPA: ABC transporter permease [Bacteroidales bacterium]|jgi:lipoprotein-releasing system permease protein|nr:ABC transporter permease [Bacteroidales bacterium]